MTTIMTVNEAVRVKWLEQIDKTRGDVPTILEVFNTFKYLPMDKWHSKLAEKGWAWLPRYSKYDLTDSILHLLRVVDGRGHEEPKVDDLFNF